MGISRVQVLAVLVGFTGIACAQIMGMEEPEVVDTLPDDNGSGGGGQGGGGTGGSGGDICDPMQYADGCQQCIAGSQCCEGFRTCRENGPCRSVLDCVVQCIGIGDTLSNCNAQCGGDGNVAFVGLRACISTQCGSPCNI